MTFVERFKKLCQSELGCLFAISRLHPASDDDY